MRIGAHAFVGGATRVAKDVPPYVKAAGSPMELYGLNSVGLQRRGFPEEVRRELKRAYRLFFASNHNVAQALARAREELRGAAGGGGVPRLLRELRARGAGLRTPPRAAAPTRGQGQGTAALAAH